MKISRLYQPDKPAFWMMLALNLVSAALVWIVRSFEPAFVPMLVLVGLALVNAALGIWFMARLLRDDKSRW